MPSSTGDGGPLAPVRTRARPARFFATDARRLACMLLLVGALVAFGCGERGEERGDAGAGAQPGYGGTVVVLGPNDLDYANSLVNAEGYTAELLRFALFLPLIRYDAELNFEPYLAEGYELLGDTGVVFRLRQNVYWHDSVKTSAHDVLFTYERAKDPATAFPNADYFAKWGAAEIIDSFTIRFRFEPHADALAGWAFTPIMPRHLLKAFASKDLRNAPFNKNPVGNGPFKFVSYQANDRWVFEANPSFPQELGGRPYLDRLVWRVVPENPAQLTEVLSGNADLMISTRADQVKQHDPAADLRGIIKPSRKYDFIAWNGKRPPFDNPRVRKALTLAIDRKEILDALRGGFGELAAGPIAPFHWAFDASLRPLPYDTAAARAILTELGFRDRNGDGILEDERGKRFVFSITIPAGVDFSRDVAEMVRADLEAVGVRMTTRQLEANTLIGDIFSPERRFDATILRWEADFRIGLYDLFHSAALNDPYQFASYSNPEVDRIIDQAPLISDRERAFPMWKRLQEIMRDEQPWTFMFYLPELYLMRERVRGADMDIRGTFVNVQRWWVQSAQPVTAGGAAD